eukprot:CAMPEP_0119324418 /NCGR_PEP_ID=MMETSP1333-20130426/63165_1 /TAXON_ID=418940 /ORGANISM="Scyphosphaera apsteinii, Strain RCC1455" /LENGTH=1378 /DNA_ID=CAMNT_0007332113 /DNA_START=227 /DNA_END=4363 /DNA_ORIENTATION=-
MTTHRYIEVDEIGQVSYPLDMAVKAVEQACHKADALVIEVKYERDRNDYRYQKLDYWINKCLDKRPDFPIFSVIQDSYTNPRLHSYVGPQNWDQGVRCANAIMFGSPYAKGDHSTVTGRAPPRPYPVLAFEKRCPNYVCTVAWASPDHADSGLARRFAGLNATLALYGARAEIATPSPADFAKINTVKALQTGVYEIKETGEPIQSNNFWPDAPGGFVTLLHSGFVTLSGTFFDPKNSLNCGFTLQSAPQVWQVGTSPFRDALTVVSSAAAAARLDPLDWLAAKGNDEAHSGSFTVVTRQEREPVDDPRRATHGVWGASCAYGLNASECRKLTDAGYIHRRDMWCCGTTKEESGDNAYLFFDDEGRCLLAFRGSAGTDKLMDLYNDLQNDWVDYMGLHAVGSGIRDEFDGLWNAPNGVTNVLSGESQEAFQLLRQKCTQHLDVSGHSLGGALAMIFAALANRKMANGLPSLGQYVDKVWGFADLPSAGMRLVNEQSIDGCFAGGSFHTKKRIGQRAYNNWWFGDAHIADWAVALNVNPQGAIWPAVGALLGGIASAIGCGPFCIGVGASAGSGLSWWFDGNPLLHPRIKQYEIMVEDSDTSLGYDLSAAILAANCGEMPQTVHDTAFQTTVKAQALLDFSGGAHLHDVRKYVIGTEGGGYFSAYPDGFPDWHRGCEEDTDCESRMCYASYDGTVNQCCAEGEWASALTALQASEGGISARYCTDTLLWEPDAERCCSRKMLWCGSNARQVTYKDNDYCCADDGETMAKTPLQPCTPVDNPNYAGPVVAANVVAVTTQDGNSFINPSSFPAQHRLSGKKVVAFSGGGTRAFSCGIGALRALHKLGLMSKVDGIAGVSGGNWVSGLYMFQQRYTTEELLGIVNDTSTMIHPASLTKSALGGETVPLGKPPATMSAAMDVAIDSVMTTLRLRRRVPPSDANASPERKLQEIYMDHAALFAYVYMEPFGLDDTQSYIAKDDADVQRIKHANPTLASATFQTVSPDKRNITYMSGGMLIAPWNWDRVDKEDHEGSSGMAYLSMAADYTGVAAFPDNKLTRFTSVTSGDIELKQGGGLIETFAFGGAAPQNVNDQGGRGETNAVVVGKPPTPFSLSDMLVLSSWAEASNVVEDVLEYTRLYWPVTWTTSEGDGTQGRDLRGPQKAEWWKMGDGGNMENIGLIQMIQRGATKGVALLFTGIALADQSTRNFCATDANSRPLRDHETGISLQDYGVDQSIGGLFGYGETASSKFQYEKNQVFSKAEFGDLLCAFQQNVTTGRAAVVKKRHKLVPNTYWGIAGGGEVEVLWYLHQKITSFTDQLPPTVQAELASCPDDCPDWTFMGKHYPNIGTGFHLPSHLVNLLMHHTEYAIMQSRDLFAEFLGD